MMGCVDVCVEEWCVCFGEGGRDCWEMDLNINAGRSSLIEELVLRWRGEEVCWGEFLG